MMARWMLVLYMGTAMLAWADGMHPRTPVTREEVWEAVVAELRTRGLPDAQWPKVDDLELPLAVPAAANRTLRVASACWDDEFGRAEFRLECHESRQCVPFLVYARMARARWAEISGNTVGSACGSALHAHTANSAPHKPMVRAGDRATLIFVANRLRLTTPVTCLEHGAEGQVIRVRNQDGQILRARVSAPALLEALPQ